jgi:hypothetical protein
MSIFHGVHEEFDFFPLFAPVRFVPWFKTQ